MNNCNRRRDLETVAAFLDGQLSNREATTLVERLENEPRLYEVFTSAARERGLSLEALSLDIDGDPN